MTETAQGYHTQRYIMLTLNSALTLLFLYTILTEKKEVNKKTGWVKRNMPYMARRLSLLLSVLSTVNSVDSSSYLGVYPTCFVRGVGFSMAQVLIVIVFVWGYNIFRSSYYMVQEDANLTQHKVVILVSITLTTTVGLIGAALTCDEGHPQYYLLPLCAGGALGLSLICYVCVNMYRLNKLLSGYIQLSVFDSEQLLMSLKKLKKFFVCITVVGALLEIRNTVRIYQTASMTAEEKEEVQKEPFGPRDKFLFTDVLFSGLFAVASIILLWYVWNQKPTGEEGKSMDKSSSHSQLPPIPLHKSTSTRSSNHEGAV